MKDEIIVEAISKGWSINVKEMWNNWIEHLVFFTPAEEIAEMFSRQFKTDAAMLNYLGEARIHNFALEYLQDECHLYLPEY